MITLNNFGQFNYDVKTVVLFVSEIQYLSSTLDDRYTLIYIYIYIYIYINNIPSHASCQTLYFISRVEKQKRDIGR